MPVAYQKERILHPRQTYGGQSRDSYTGSVQSHIVTSPHDLERLDFSMSHPYPYRSGGPFLVRKTELIIVPSEMADEWWHTINWKGNHVPGPMPLQTDMLALPSIPDTTMVHMGTKAWDKFKPAEPDMDLGQFLGELKDFPSMATPFKNGPPSSPRLAVEWFKKHAQSAKSAGKAYLSYEFGWKPFVNDLANLILSTANLEKRLKQLKRDNGRNVRRRGTVKSEVSSSSTTETKEGVFIPTAGSYWANGGKGTRVVQQKTNVHFWFSGSFKYFIPDIPDSPTDLSNLNRLLRLTPSPKLVWELTPWSWLADYWGNIGSILSNISGNAADSLVASYAYIMGTEEHVTKTSVSFKGKSGKDYHCSSTLIRSVKRRHPATPYGFGVDLSGLSTKQIAILSALGLSRLRGNV